MRKKFISWLAHQIVVIMIKWNGNEPHFRRAIKKAEKLARGNRYGCRGKRHYIYFIGAKYRVLNRKQIQYWRNHTPGVKTDLKVSEMTGIQLYDTQGHVNSHPTYTHIEIKGIDIQYIRSCNLNTTIK